MNIVLITFLGRHGGIQYPAQLANALSKCHDVTVIIPNYADITYFNERANLIKVYAPLNPFRTLLRTFNLLSFRNLIKRINPINPDVIHMVIDHPWCSIYALLLRRKYPIITTIHEPNPLSRQIGGTILSIRPILVVNNKILAIISDNIIVHGKNLREYLLTKNVPDSKVETIPHGDYSFFKRWEKKEIQTQKNNILFFGTITPYKGIEYLIQAEKLIKEHVSNPTITIAGEGNIRKYEKQISQNSNFRILNKFIPDEEVAELFQKASLVVLPYTQGSQSGVVHIAYAFKKPVVATNVGSIPEIVDDGKTGFIVPSKDSKALAEAIIRILKNSELRKEMGENAYRKMKDELSWDKNAEKTVEVYKEAIKNHAAAHRKMP